MLSSKLALIFTYVLLAGAHEQGTMCHGDENEQGTMCHGDEHNHEDVSSFLQSKVTEMSSVERHKQESLGLDHRFAVAAQAMPEGTATKSLLQSFRICGQCNNFQRFGEQHDGGYLMCMDGLSKDSVRAAYSMGVEQHDQWSEDVIKSLGVSLNQFDCTVASSACQSCKFFKKCIVSSDGKHTVPGHEGEGWNLQKVLTETSQEAAPKGSLLMKMDIEASEWPIFATEPSTVLEKFGELIVEFHWLDKVDRHAEYLKAMQHIAAAGFKVAHLHGNNFGGMYEVGGASIPNVVEVTFVHGAARPDGCSPSQLYDKKLDAPNNPNNAELPMAKMSAE